MGGVVAAFDELYVRFFRSAVECQLAADGMTWKDGWVALEDDAERWRYEAIVWGKAAAALFPYISQARRGSLEQSFFKGQFTLDDAGEVRMCDASSAK